MPVFKYQAKNKDGQIYERSIEAPDRLSLYGIIREEGGVVISIKEEKKRLSSISFGSFLGRVKTQQKINFARNLSAMINAGLSVTRALGVMSKQSKNKAFVNLVSGIEEDVSHGLTLSDALAKRSNVFSPLFVSMVKAGEESGSVSTSLATIAAQMEKSNQLAKKVRGALIYPAVIISVMIILAVLLLIFMVPTLTATFEGIGVELPLSTRILIALSSFLVEQTLLVFSLLFFLIAGSVAFMRSKRDKKVTDQLFLRIPIIGEMVKEVQVARTARTLSSLLSAGVEIVVALDVTSEVLQNHLYKDVMVRARNGIQKGETLSSIFNQYESLYPVFISEMASVGEETGKISQMLSGVADYYEDEIDQKTKNLSTIIEPVLMVVMGIGVGIFAISMLSPTYSLVDYL